MGKPELVIKRCALDVVVWSGVYSSDHEFDREPLQVSDVGFKTAGNSGDGGLVVCTCSAADYGHHAFFRHSAYLKIALRHHGFGLHAREEFEYLRVIRYEKYLHPDVN